MEEFNSTDFQKRLLTWFEKNRRDLPWRTNFSRGTAPLAPAKTQRDPYSVVVSEVMLQQTQVTTVLRFYDNWMTQFPTFAALAAAPIERVLKAWEGLGYYTRARNLKKLAEAVVNQYGGQLPRSVEELHNLPGIGPYSARSIASLAFNAPAACVDGNIVRVLSRLLAIDKSYKSGSAAQHDFQPIADSSAGVGIHAKRETEFNYGEYNEAMMEFGATVCTKANPLCPSCPMKDLCKAYALGIAEELPRFEKTKLVSKAVKRAWVMHEGKLLLHQSSVGNNAETGKLHGLWELPTPETLGITRLPDKELLRRVRNITKYKITEVIYKITNLEKLLPRIEKQPHLRWASMDDLKELPMSGPHAQWIEELLRRNK